MRLWSVHPEHLDRAGLVAGWREALLAQAVLAGRTRGYHAHPQLQRFQQAPQPVELIGDYLAGLHAEAVRRRYRFDGTKILARSPQPRLLEVTTGQIAYEWEHLGRKLLQRSPSDAERWRASAPTPHPIFEVVSGEIAAWERVQ